MSNKKGGAMLAHGRYTCYAYKEGQKKQKRSTIWSDEKSFSVIEDQGAWASQQGLVREVA